MIEAESFIKSAKSHGFYSYTGVPCSFLTPFINYVINDDKLIYIGSANEGDALATAAGMKIGGQRSVVMLQNSGLGNAVNPLTSLNHTFRIPVLIIITLRGDPQLQDEPQHELMGKMTGNLLDLMGITWDFFPDSPDKIEPAMKTAADHMTHEHLPYAFIMRKGTVQNEPLNTRESLKARQGNGAYYEDSNNPQGLSSRKDVLSHLVETTDINNCILVASTGYTGRELYALNDRINHLYMVGSMGCAGSLGLGIAITQPDKSVIVIEGDGSALMRMGNFATIGHYAMNNFVHIILDNEMHDSTGGQSTVSRNVNFARIAQACNYPVTFFGNNMGLIDQMNMEYADTGPKLLHLKIKPGTTQGLPRPDQSPQQVVGRLMKHLGTS